MKICSFFGHRKIVETEELIQRIRNTVVNLIEKHNVKVFLFGSRSDFDALCHLIVSELKDQYPEIEKRAYTCRSETCIFQSFSGTDHCFDNVRMESVFRNRKTIFYKGAR